MRLLHACHPSQTEALTERLYKAYWQENLDVDDDVVIDTIAHDFAIGTKGILS
jgi:predicted DsbA family dithiol-disulfide isomerase